MKKHKPTEKTQKLLDNLVIIGNWAKSCKTLDQLDLVSEFIARNYLTWKYSKQDTEIVSYNLGMVDGIILTLTKTKFKNH